MIEIVVVALVAAAVLLLARWFIMRGAGSATASRTRMASIVNNRFLALREAFRTSMASIQNYRAPARPKASRTRMASNVSNRAPALRQVSRTSMVPIVNDHVPALHGKGLPRKTDTDSSRDIISIIDALPRDPEALRETVQRTTRTTRERADATIAYYQKRYSLTDVEACRRIIMDRELGR